jgi:hypothetical protein
MATVATTADSAITSLERLLMVIGTAVDSFIGKLSFDPRCKSELATLTYLWRGLNQDEAGLAGFLRKETQAEAAALEDRAI